MSITEPNELKIDKLKQIKTALEALSKTTTTLALVIARNLSKVTQLVTHEEKTFRETQQSFFVKDESGKVIQFIGKPNGEILTDEAKEERVFKNPKETPLGEGEVILFKYSDVEAVNSLVSEYNNHDYSEEIQLNKFNPEVLERALESGQISAEMLIPLIGTIIPE